MISNLLLIFLVLSAGSGVVFGEDDEFTEEMYIYKTAIDFVNECGSNNLSLCLKERALRYVDHLPNELNVGEAFKIKPSGRFSRKATVENLPDEPRARENAVENILWNRVADYLSSHSIEFKVPPDTLQEMKNSVEEGRGKGGGGGGGGGGGKGGSKGGGGMGMKGMFMLFQMKAALLGAIALKMIGLIAFKALLVAKIALTISSVIALKKLVEQKHHGPTYEVIAAHPHEEYGHYDRSFRLEQIAYKGQNGISKSIYQ